MQKAMKQQGRPEGFEMMKMRKHKRLEVQDYPDRRSCGKGPGHYVVIRHDVRHDHSPVCVESILQ